MGCRQDYQAIIQPESHTYQESSKLSVECGSSQNMMTDVEWSEESLKSLSGIPDDQQQNVNKANTRYNMCIYIDQVLSLYFPVGMIC